MGVTTRNNSWYVDFSFEGKRIRKKSPVNTSAGAKNYESSLRAKLLSGEAGNEFEKEQNQSFKDYAWMWFEKYAKANNKHSEILMKENILRLHLVPYFGKTRLNKIGAYQIEQFKDYKLRKDYTKKTVNNQLTVLSKCLNTAGEWFNLDPVPKVKLFKVRYEERKFLEKEEAQRFLAAADGVWHEMAMTALNTGLRLGELIALDWKDIDIDQRLLTVRHSIVRGMLGLPKNGKQRIIPLSESLAALFRKNRKSHGYVFYTRKDFPLSTNNCSINIGKICDMAGLKRFGWHTLRHTFATQLAHNNSPIVTIKELMGHADIKTTMRYAHVVPSTLREAIRTLDTEDNFGHRMVTALQEGENIVDLSTHLNPALLAKVKENKPLKDLSSN